MESESFITSSKTSSEFGEIVLKQIRRVLKIASEDKSENRYCASVEALGHILMPYFDDDAKKVYEEYDHIMNNFFGRKKLHEKFEEEWSWFKKWLEGQDFDEDYRREHQIAFFDMKKLQCAKELFYELNLLLKRQDYLKGAIYGEGLSEGLEDLDKKE